MGQASDAACNHPPAMHSNHHTPLRCPALRPGGRPLSGEKLEGVCSDPNRLRMLEQATRLRSGLCHARHHLEPLHRTAFGVQDDEVQALDLVHFASLGHVAHGVGNEPANGVEVFF